MNLHEHGLPFPKDGPGQATHPTVRWLYCCHILQLMSRCEWTAWEARDGWQIRGIRVSKLSSEQRNRPPNPPKLGWMVKGTLYVILSGTYPDAHTEAPSLSFTAHWTPELWKCWLWFFCHCRCLMSGHVVDSISNQHDLIGHDCFPFPLLTKALHFSLSLHLILFIVWEITKFSSSNLTVPVVF